MILWQPAQDAFVAWTCNRSRAVFKLGSGSSSFEKSTFGGGVGTFWHRKTSRSALPRRVAELRAGCACAARKATCIRRPARGLPSGKSYGLQPLPLGTPYTAARFIDMKVLRVVNRSR